MFSSVIDSLVIFSWSSSNETFLDESGSGKLKRWKYKFKNKNFWFYLNYSKIFGTFGLSLFDRSSFIGFFSTFSLIKLKSKCFLALSEQNDSRNANESGDGGWETSKSIKELKK